MNPKKPGADEYAPYHEKYVGLIPGDDIVSVLEAHLRQSIAMFSGRSEREGDFRYAPDKWTVKEILCHVADAERIFSYRALRIARGDQTPLPGFDQDQYVPLSRANERKLPDIVEEFADVRRASISLFGSLDAAAWMRKGVASNHELSVRALAYIAAGHELHHRRILEERYFPAIPRA
ncbi:MAG TPA: DinB family protein [Candidatus Eremiobacteraceae bacterium]|nr:DinB family protein [Candidatus Eremiobacteraceae bacterium]